VCGGDLQRSSALRGDPRLLAGGMRIGPSGSGQLAKMVNQLCIAGTLEGLAEGIEFGQRAHLDMELC